ncbi:transcription elongation factor GreAB [Mycobacterium scrofulaceum]|uniref:Transcription elongation factor GreAB n=1 Tax=Mycobacterium scrofulaceum TaxID=1783 RepID=A0A1X0KJ42_MYCSC|nr:transcription elongation factor GreAB [Mycobacterium scrofulaceum]
MTSVQPAWLSPQAYGRLQRELATLRESCDADADADEYCDAVRRARRLRIHDLLVNAVVGQDPPDDGIAEPGMVLTVRYDDTGEVETFLLGTRGAEHDDVEVYSVHSPLGSAITGARPGERRSYVPPSGVRLTVTLVWAVPYGIHRRATVTPRPERVVKPRGEPTPVRGDSSRDGPELVGRLVPAPGLRPADPGRQRRVRAGDLA